MQGRGGKTNLSNRRAKRKKVLHQERFRCKFVSTAFHSSKAHFLKVLPPSFIPERRANTLLKNVHTHIYTKLGNTYFY